MSNVSNNTLFGIYIFTSFHIHSNNCIKVYQYWNSTKTKRVGGRFFPVDIQKVWQKYFVVNDINKQFLMDKNLYSTLMKIKIPDHQFVNWYQQKINEFKINGYNLYNLRQ
eukprot:494629_1